MKTKIKISLFLTIALSSSCWAAGNPDGIREDQDGCACYENLLQNSLGQSNKVHSSLYTLQSIRILAENGVAKYQYQFFLELLNKSNNFYGTKDIDYARGIYYLSKSAEQNYSDATQFFYNKQNIEKLKKINFHDKYKLPSILQYYYQYLLKTAKTEQEKNFFIQKLKELPATSSK